MRQYFKDIYKGMKLLPEVIGLALSKKAKDLEAYTNHDYERGYADAIRDLMDKS